MLTDPLTRGLRIYRGGDGQESRQHRFAVSTQANVKICIQTSRPRAEQVNQPAASVLGPSGSHTLFTD
jgi:hypothetical protein